MTLSTLRTYLTNFTTDFHLDNFLAASPSNANLTDLINWAIRLFSKRTFCNFDHKITFTLTASTASYNARNVTSPVVSRKVLQPLFVTINENPLMGPTGRTPGMWGYSQLSDYRWAHQTEDDGVPFRAAWLPGNKILLSPAPTAAVVTDGSNFIAGCYLAANMTNVTDDANEPDIPEEYHEVLAYLAARKAALPRASDDEAWASIQAFDKEAWLEIAAMAEDNKARLLGSSANRGYGNDWLRELIW